MFASRLTAHTTCNYMQTLTRFNQFIQIRNLSRKINLLVETYTRRLRILESGIFFRETEALDTIRLREDDADDAVVKS